MVIALASCKMIWGTIDRLSCMYLGLYSGAQGDPLSLLQLLQVIVEEEPPQPPPALPQGGEVQRPAVRAQLHVPW